MGGNGTRLIIVKDGKEMNVRMWFYTGDKDNKGNMLKEYIHKINLDEEEQTITKL